MANSSGLSLPTVDKTRARGGGYFADALVVVAALGHGLLQPQDDGVDERGTLGLGQARGVADAGIVAADGFLVAPVPFEIGSQGNGASNKNSKPDTDELPRKTHNPLVRPWAVWCPATRSG